MDGEIEELRASRDKLLAQIGQLQEKIGSLEDEIRLRRLKEYRERVGTQLRGYFLKNFKVRSAVVILEPEDVNLWGMYKRRLFASLSVEKDISSEEAEELRDAASLRKFLRDRQVSSLPEDEEGKRELIQIIESNHG